VRLILGGRILHGVGRGVGCVGGLSGLLSRAFRLGPVVAIGIQPVSSAQQGRHEGGVYKELSHEPSCGQLPFVGNPCIYTDSVYTVSMVEIRPTRASGSQGQQEERDMSTEPTIQQIIDVTGGKESRDGESVVVGYGPL